MHSLFTVHSNLTSVSNSHFVNWNSAPGRSTPGVNVIPIPRVRRRKRTEADTACKKKMKTTKARDTESTAPSSTSGSRGTQPDRTTASVTMGGRNARKAVARKGQYARSTPHTSVMSSSSLSPSVPVAPPSPSLQPPVCDLPPAAWPGDVAGTFYDNSPIVTSASERVMRGGVLEGGIPPQHTRRHVPVQRYTMPPDTMFYHSSTSLPRPGAYGSQLHDTYRAVAQYSVSAMVPDPHFDTYGQMWHNPAIPLRTHACPSATFRADMHLFHQMPLSHSPVASTMPGTAPPPHNRAYSDFSCNLSCCPPSRPRHSREIMDPPHTTFDEHATVAQHIPPHSDIWANAHLSTHSELIGATEVINGGVTYSQDVVNDLHRYVAADGEGSQGASSIIDSGNEFGWPNVDSEHYSHAEAAPSSSPRLTYPPSFAAPGLLTEAGDCEIPASFQSAPTFADGQEWRCQSSSLAYALGGHGPLLPSL